MHYTPYNAQLEEEWRETNFLFQKEFNMKIEEITSLETLILASKKNINHLTQLKEVLSLFFD